MGSSPIKIVYIGVYRDSTGYGQMATNTLMALHAAGADVTARPVKLNDASPLLPPPILEMERKRADKYDVVIQNLLPSQMDYSGHIPLNAAYFCTETDRITSVDWVNKLNTMDAALVCNEQSAQACMFSGVTAPLSVVPIACDTSKYQRQYKPLSIRERLGDSFVFYYIGDFNMRKNIKAIIQAFHIEFDVGEPVNLVIKTDIGQSTDDYGRMKNRELVIQDINRIKEGMKLYRSVDSYKPEIVLVGQYTDEEIMRLHASCDCFVCPSHGEAWGIVAFDAMAMGKTPILSEWGGFLEYATHENAFLVPGHLEPVYGMTRNTADDLFTSRERWFSVSVPELQRAMRNAYEYHVHKARKEMVMNGRMRAYDFSYEKVGKAMLLKLEKRLCKSHGY